MNSLSQTVWADDPPSILPFRPVRDEDAPPDATLTLRLFYQRRLLPEIIADQASHSLLEDRIALGHWERLTGNPDIREADNPHLERLRDGLLAAGLSRATVNKTWRELKAIFEAAREMGYLSKVPQIGFRQKSRLVKEPAKKQRETLTTAEVERIFLAASRADFPKRASVPAPRLWRAVIVLFWLYGPRTRDLFSLRWEDVLFTDRLIRFEAMKTRKLQGLPLTDVAVAHLQSIRGRSANVFPGFTQRGCYLKKHGRWKPGYYTCWRTEILPAASIDPPIVFKHFRESMVTRHNSIEPGLGNWIAGHYVPGVSAQHYDLPTQRIRAAIESAPIPDCFRDVFEEEGQERQLSLFE